MISIQNGQPALILAPMDGLTDAPMRAVQGEIGAFTFSVSEFIRVAQEIPPVRQFQRDVPELIHGSITPTGLPVQVQILGGDPERMAEAAARAIQAGATAIDINFGCPAPTVNRHDGGATLLKDPPRIRAVVAAVRQAVPAEFPVSAKMRLGWDSIEPVLENAAMAEEGGASWITIHGRTKIQRYEPPAHWEPIGLVKEKLSIPVVANGDIWSVQDFRRCRDVTGCSHFMLGRCAIANPNLSHAIAAELGLFSNRAPISVTSVGDKLHTGDLDWTTLVMQLIRASKYYAQPDAQTLCRVKQWLSMAARFGEFSRFDFVKRSQSIDELMAGLIDPEVVPSYSPACYLDNVSHKERILQA